MQTSVSDSSHSLQAPPVTKMASTQSTSVAISSTPKPLPLCPVETTLQMIRSRWAVLILRDLFSGTKRFSDLKRSLTASPKRCLPLS